MTPASGTSSPAPRARVWRFLALASCALFLASVARFYHPGSGFTALIAFPAAGHGSELPALRALPHLDYPTIAYDGQFYAQLALEPLLRDPAIDRALDLPGYRGRRILFSWTAYALGLGRPAWILQAFALQNVLCWLVLAWLITRWIPPDSPRLFALWAACMFSHGLLWSVRFSLLDGPSVLVLTIAVLTAERHRTWTTAALVGLAGLGRETNLLGAVALPWRRGVRGWLMLAVALAIVVLPLAIWQDYLFSIYRSRSLVGGNQLTTPFRAYLGSWHSALSGVQLHGSRSLPMQALLVVISLTVQAMFLVWSRQFDQPWWRLAAAYAGLMVIVHSVVWDGYPGAITRVVLPLTFGFNILLAQQRGRSFWIWFVLGNLHVLPGQGAMPIPGVPVVL